jgi:hypothetical protein
MIEPITKEYYIENLEWWHYRDESRGLLTLPLGYSVELILPHTLNYLKINVMKEEVRICSDQNPFTLEVIEEAEKISYQNHMYEKRIPERYREQIVNHINILIELIKKDTTERLFK